MRWMKLLLGRFAGHEDPEDAFTREVVRYGGVLGEERYGGLQRTMAEVCAATLDALRSGQPEGHLLPRLLDRIRLRIVENWDPNALVLPVRRQSYIGIYGGAATVVPAVTFAAWRSERVFPDLPGGDPHDESFSPLVTCLAERRMYEHGGGAEVSAETLYRPPATDARHEMAQVVAALVWQFICLHEVSHVLGGHLDFVHRELGLAMLLEAGEGPGARPGLPITHAIELDADARAAALLVELSDPTWSAPEGREAAIESRLRGQLIALGILFELFDWESLPLREAGGRFHPHPAVRMVSAIEVLADVYRDRFGIAAEQFESTFNAALGDLSQIGEPLNWTLGQVILAEEAEIGRQVERLRGLYDAAARRSGLRAMLRRKGLGGVGWGR